METKGEAQRDRREEERGTFCQLSDETDSDFGGERLKDRGREAETEGYSEKDREGKGKPT